MTASLRAGTDTGGISANCCQGNDMIHTKDGDCGGNDESKCDYCTDDDDDD